MSYKLYFQERGPFTSIEEFVTVLDSILMSEEYRKEMILKAVSQLRFAQVLTKEDEEYLAKLSIDDL